MASWAKPGVGCPPQRRALAAACGRSTKTPLTHVRGTVDPARYRWKSVHRRTSTRRTPDGWRVSKPGCSGGTSEAMKTQARRPVRSTERSFPTSTSGCQRSVPHVSVVACYKSTRRRAGSRKSAAPEKENFGSATSTYARRPLTVGVAPQEEGTWPRREAEA